MSIAEHLHEMMPGYMADDIGRRIAALDKKHKAQRMALRHMYIAFAVEEGIEPDYDTARKAAAKAASVKDGDD